MRPKASDTANARPAESGRSAALSARRRNVRIVTVS
jgi:hypothetical protein